jgi:carboxypeptidase Taq
LNNPDVKEQQQMARDELTRLKALDREITTLNGIRAALDWDQQVYMPERGVNGRAEQLAAMAALVHRKSTSEEIGSLLKALGASDENPGGDKSLDQADRALIRAIYRDYVHDTRLPEELVTRIAKVTSVAQSVWADARKKSDFSLFRPHLQEIVDLSLEVAERLGYDDHPYDALVDQFEPGMRTADIAKVFRKLREALVPLVRRIGEKRQVEYGFLLRGYPAHDQEEFGREILNALGFDFKRGRLDISVHPFTTSLGGDDVRITTRYDEEFFQTALFGIIHEAGHALYELGFKRDYHGSRLAEGTSLGVHESMSRFWENVVGRSRPFWRHFFPILKGRFPEQLSGVDVEQFYRAVNRVEPSHIRVEADEVTYSLHIILRFELERMLLSKELAVKDLPYAWREQSRDLLGIVPEHDSEGVLQDIHWSGGAIGYFPTYALGNVYGLQFVSRLRQDVAGMDGLLHDGNLGPIKEWLDGHIHSHGRALTPDELCRSITGEPMTAKYFIEYLDTKYTDVYGL